MSTGIIFGDNASAEELTSLTIPQFDFYGLEVTLFVQL